MNKYLFVITLVWTCCTILDYSQDKNNAIVLAGGITLGLGLYRLIKSQLPK